MRIALIGDYDRDVVAHQAIPGALELAALSLAAEVEIAWIGSDAIDPDALGDFDAIWCVPLSPYRDPLAVVAAIEFARVSDTPFLGTCAGFQHAVLEYARNQLAYAQAESIEDNPDTRMPLIGALACRLADHRDGIYLRRESRVAKLYRTEYIVEEYNCGFGVNPEYLGIFDSGELRFCGHDKNGDPRVFELDGHRFFVGTAYQPERSALQGVVHPLVAAFVMAGI